MMTGYKVLISAAVLIACSGYGGHSQKKLRPVIRQVDHILVESSAARELFDLFTDELLLPAAWPFGSSSAFESGGIGAGNVNIEIFRYGGAQQQQARSGARFTGLAFQPYPLVDSLPELASRGIRYDPPQSHVSTLPGGRRGTLWTTVVLPQFARPRLSVFLYEYSGEFLNVEVKRKQLAGELVLKKGGRLGIVEVTEIVIGTSNMKEDRSEWARLLQPAGISAGAILPAGEGPAIRLIASADPAIHRIVFRVNSLAAAREALRKRRWLGSAAQQEIALRPAAVQGLDIRFRER